MLMQNSTIVMQIATVVLGLVVELNAGLFPQRVHPLLDLGVEIRRVPLCIPAEAQ